MENPRLKLVQEAFMKRPLEVASPIERPADLYAKKVFTRTKMMQYLEREVYEQLIDVIDNGTPLDSSIADAVAQGMKEWAFEHGVTHYTHWFQPLNEGTAEKHDAFLEFDGQGGMIENFSGKLLVQQEPDASSFPSGGIRSTFEARGYSAWDPTSPVFIVDDTLCIPTVFISYTGEALDYKAPLLKALKAINEAGTAVAKLFYPDVKRVTCNLGWEQEYFLVDEGLYAARPDLLLTGRTLMGHDSAKDQQLDDHYFGIIPDRVQAFMKDLEQQALELAIPCKTRHNEAAPNQFELAPIFEETNLAIDHNMLLMSLMKKVARKHGLRVLLHEKPFDGINGSGKHNNWSLATDTGILLHAPGKTPEGNLCFLTFIVETLMGVYRHNGLLKASIMSATNAHRLGGCEAPPMIISSFLGQHLTALLEGLVNGDELQQTQNAKDQGKHKKRLVIPELPELLIDNTDRNRTSPFAFTGNRFEFRAIGSEANCASAMIALNASVAEALNDFYARVRTCIDKGENLSQAVIRLLREDIRTCAPIRFDGNGYAEEWQQEAQRRGLDVERSCPVIFDRYLDTASIEMFGKLKIFTEKELQARNEIKWDTYTKTVQIEARVLGDIVLSHIVPIATKYQSLLAKNVNNMMDIFGKEEALNLSERNIKIIREIAERTQRIEVEVEEMVDARKVANTIEDARAKAIAYHDTVEPKMQAIRNEIDHLELIVADEFWTLPKYRELLFC